MIIVGRHDLAAFWGRHPTAKAALAAWYALVQQAQWKTPTDVKAQFGTRVTALTDGRMAFELSGMDYRLAVRICYVSQIVAIAFVGTQEEFDRAGLEKA